MSPYVDHDRDGRLDAGPEQLLAYRGTETVAPESQFGRHFHSFFLEGVTEGEQICNVRSLRVTPLAGGRPTTSTTELTCYAVVWD